MAGTDYVLPSSRRCRWAAMMPQRSGTCCTVEQMNRPVIAAIEIGDLARYERPLPVMTGYDQLLSHAMEVQA